MRQEMKNTDQRPRQSRNQDNNAQRGNCNKGNCRRAANKGRGSGSGGQGNQNTLDRIMAKVDLLLNRNQA